ncbi:MAG: hypothetical protein Q9187_006674 [Circinaria calcarea]
MEAIALLYMLNQFPESPKDNQPPQALSILSALYQLPFQREKEIVDNLAFLSVTRNDPSRVMAVCLEEARDRGSCTIRLTSNTSDLNEVVYRFNLMVRILERAASRVNSEDDDIKAFFRCIVTMDYFRILSRLRSSHAKKTSRNKDKPILLTLLDTTIHDQSIQPSSNIIILELADIRTKVNALKALFLRFEGIPKHFAESAEVQDMAMDLITQMHELDSQMMLKLALGSSSLEGSIKKFLPEAVGKLGRYCSISYELICAARNKEYSIFNSIIIEASSIRRPSQPSNIDKSFHPLTALQNVLRPRTTVESRALKPSLERRMGKPLQVILNEFHSIITDYYQFAKVHAEIQLLFFYELNPGRLRPRVICSSKSACYLCDLFFKLHGRFYVPRTHGRLYHKWTFPDWHILVPEMRRLDFDVLLKQFSDVLKVRIRAALESSPVRVNHPNESVLIMPAHWSSSTVTQVTPSVSEPVAALRLLQPQEELPEVLDSVTSIGPISSEVPAPPGLMNPDLLLSEPPPQAELLTTATSSPTTSTSTLHPPAQEPIISRDIPTPDTFIEPPTISHTPLNPSPIATPKPYCDLTQGEPTWQPILYPNISINIGTTRLHLHLSCDTSPSPTPDLFTNPSSRCWVRVKWLQGTETEKINAEAVNVEDLTCDTEMKFEHGAACTPTELHLRRGEDVVSIKYTLERPRRE